MAYCPDCLVEYHEGKTECIDCGVALRPGPPPQPAAGSGDDVELVSLADFGGQEGRAWSEGLDPELACAVLNEEGIPAHLAADSRSHLGVVLGGVSALQLFVRKEDASRAAELLKAFFNAPAQAPGDEGNS